MIYVLTVHYKSDRFIEPQLRYLARHMSEPYRIYANLEGVEEHAGRFDKMVPSVGSHAAKLNLLAAHACHDGEPEDVLVFLDGDAFPVADPMPTVRIALAETGFIAVQRLENLGDIQPHPLFAATRVATWKEVSGDWSHGHSWINAQGQHVTDVGGNLLAILALAGQNWTPLLRSNTTDLHPVWFGVYGSTIYHHGAGFRRMRSRADDAQFGRPLFTRRIPYVRRLEQRHRDRAHEAHVVSMEELSRQVFDELMGNMDFWHRFDDRQK